MSKHTPTPWFYNRDEGGYQGHNINVAEGEICQVFDPNGEDDSIIEANARHIVKCVNLHDELVQVLQLAMTHHFDYLEDRARAILAKAKAAA